MKKKLLIKRIVSFLMMLAMIVSVCPCISTDVEAKSKTNEKDWGQIYIDYILNHQLNKNGDSYLSPYLYYNMTYDLIYIDDDDIPEIICCPAADTGAVLLYMCDDEVEYYQMPRRSSMRYIEREGVFEVSGYDWTIDNYWGRDNYYDQICVLTNGYIGDRAEGSMAYILDENGYYTDSMEYEWDEEPVSEAEYKKNYEKVFNTKKASESYSEMNILPYDCDGIILKIMAESMVYSDIAWIKAYQDFLVNRKYLEMGQDYGNETEIVGKLFDMDHDGIPELILDNGYAGRAVRYGCVYTYDNGVKYIGNGPSEAYVDYQNGYSGNLYGLYAEDAYEGYFWEYTKGNDKISNELVVHFTNAATANPIYKDYRYVAKQSLWILLKELSFYDLLEKEKIENQTGAMADLHDLLGGIGWYGGKYDYRIINSGDIDIMFFLHVMTGLKKYPGNIWERDSYDYPSREADPKDLFNYAYYRFDGNGLDWVFKNIYNIDEKQIEELHKKNEGSVYYYDNDYYTGMGGVGGGFGSYLDNIEDLGGVYQISYHQITVPDGPTVLHYDKKYALIAYKKIDGVGYWSLYKVSDRPLYEEAELIDVGFQLSDKYKPYPVVALKSTTNGKYVSCDIGGKNGEGKYDQITNPIFYVTSEEVHAYEMFYYIQLSNGQVALQNIMDKRYLCLYGFAGIASSSGMKMWGVSVSDFAENRIGNGETSYAKLDVNIKDKAVSFGYNDKWLSVENNYLKVTNLETKAERFEIVLISENDYTMQEKNILSSGEWFDLNGKGVGYWDIQYEIGQKKGDSDKKSESNVKALKTLGYTVMYRKDLNTKNNKSTIEYDNMQCSIGVKKENGIYDVIVSFQGTDGYSDETWFDNWRDYGSNLVDDVHEERVTIDGHSLVVLCHKGYYEMAHKLVENNRIENFKKCTITELDGKQITLNDLIAKARKGEANFTLLGHSMGGAIAQCYALFLVNAGVNPSQIKGRTFNSALAFANNSASDLFSDWYNLCVISDSVPRGLVMGSFMEYGMNRLGKTIWLYDNSPDKNIETSVSSTVANIVLNKHNMDKVIKDVLLNTTSSAYRGFSEVDSKSVYITNKKNIPIYDRPKKDSDPAYTIDGIHTVVDMESYTYNDAGNKWYKTKDGKFIYSGNIEVLKKQNIGAGFLNGFVIQSKKAPLRAGCYEDTEKLETLKKGDIIEVDYAVKNGGGNLWLHTTVNGKTGWIWDNHTQRMDPVNNTFYKLVNLISIDCPVNVSLYDSNDELAASIVDGEIYTADQRAINPYMIGNGKYFEIFDEEAYYVEIDSLADGMMDYTISSDYDEKTGEYKSVKKFEAVDLEEEQYFDSKVGGDISAEDVYLRVVDEDGNVLSEIEAVTASDEESEGIDKKQIIIIAASAAAGLIAVIGIIAAVRKKRKKKEKISNE